MCYSEQISLLTFGVMLLSSVYIIKRKQPNDRWFAIIFLLAGVMQLLEYFMWSDQKCGRTNEIATIIAFVLLMLQPVGLIGGAYQFGNLSIDKKLLLPILIIYAIVFGSQIANSLGYIKSKGIKLCSTPDGRHLSWGLQKVFGRSEIISILLMVLYYGSVVILLFGRPILPSIFVGAMLVGTLLFSVFIVRNPSWKSFWCWTVNFIPMLYILFTTKF